MSTSTFILSGRACRGCKHCEQGPALVSFHLLHWTLVLCTGLLWLAAPLFYKRCLCCGHSLYMNRHRPGA
jgi:hypothetical protein